MLLHIIIPTSNGSAHYIIYVTLGAHASAILGIMRNLLALKNSCLLAKYTVRMCAMVPVMGPPWGLMGIRDTSLGLIPPRNPHGFVAVG